MNDTELIQSWLGWAEDKKGMSQASVNDYGRTLGALLSFKTKSLRHLTVDDLETFVARPRVGRATSGVAAPATLKKEVAELRSVFKWLHDRGLVPRNVTVELVAPPAHNLAPKPVPDATWLSLWTADLTDTERVAFGLAYFTGLRRDEVCNLRKHQFLSHPRPTILDVVRKGGKRQNITWASCLELLCARRSALVPGGARSFVEPLERLLGAPGDLLLDSWDANGHGWLLPDVFNKRLTRRCDQLGIEHVTPHQFRHSFATNMIRIDVPIPIVARLCGHSSVDMTMRYVDTGEDPLGQFLVDDADVSSTPLRLVDRYGRR